MSKTNKKTLTKTQKAEMDEVIKGLTGPKKTQKSTQMRALSAAGFDRADIARYLGVIYQFVNNVLSRPLVEKD